MPALRQRNQDAPAVVWEGKLQAARPQSHIRAPQGLRQRAFQKVTFASFEQVLVPASHTLYVYVPPLESRSVCAPSLAVVAILPPFRYTSTLVDMVPDHARSAYLLPFWLRALAVSVGAVERTAL